LESCRHEAGSPPPPPLDTEGIVDLLGALPMAAYLCDPEGLITYFNPHALELWGREPRLRHAADRFCGSFKLFAQDGSPIPHEKCWMALALQDEKEYNGHEIVIERPDGSRRCSLAYASPLRHPAGQVVGAVNLLVDITEKRRAEEVFRASEEERRRLQDQLWQAQKMEAVGRLAGGIAHDFNNLLSIINGYSELVLGELSADTPLRQDVVKIRQAVERGASLIRQLLAFSRRQPRALRAMNLNTVVANIEEMLGRLIGGDVVLTLELDPFLPPIKVDPSQMEQVLINLALNARDAMPYGGNLTLETRRVDLDAEHCRRCCEGRPGRFVMLVVSDTGCGMTSDVRMRAFEPFFTTKEQGKGTGLGLATVYGIVQQSGGHLSVHSVPGLGTTFTICLPIEEEVEVVSAAFEKAEPSPAPRPGRETVLLVEDEGFVRQIVQRVLEDQGYTVLSVDSGEKGLSVAEAKGGAIQLLVTDVVMPGMSGPQLATELQSRYPEIKTLFMSGYTGDFLTRHGVTAPDAEFLAKPFTLQALAAKVRNLLDRAS
jgi:two-component system, cell cycle sensor histidine kinase and response regulator CckA